jgi:hypothetical protein
LACSNHIYRRAKIKNLAKKSLETGEDIDSIPESMRAYLAMQAMESGKGLNGSYFGRTGLSPFGASSMLLGDPNSKVCTYRSMEQHGNRHTVLTLQ